MARTKSGLDHIWLLTLIMVLSSTVSSVESSDTEPIQEALKPVYSMVNGFIKLVQPNDLDEIEDVLDKWFGKVDKGEMSTEDLLKEPEFYEDIVWYMVGFVICIAIGVILILVMIFTGFIMCCCRCCCGRCGGEVDPQEGRNSKRYRICCGVLLFVFTTILLAGCLVLFMSNELLQEQTSKEPQALLPQVNKAIYGVDDYKDKLVHDLRISVGDALQDKLSEIVDDLRQAPQTAKNALNDAISSTDIINKGTDLVDNVEEMNKSMVEIQDYTQQLKNTADSLNNQLTSLKNQISSTLNNCPAALTTDCNSVRSTVDSTSIKPDFNTMYDVSTQMNNIQNLLSSNPSLQEVIQRGVNEYEKVSNEVAQKTDEVLSDVMAEVDVVNDVMSGTLDSFEAKLHDDFNLNFTHEEINKYEDDIEEYGTYRWYAGIAIGCMFLLIVVFYYFGLLFGCTGEPPYEDGSSTCNRGVGANLFMAGVVFTFLFFWLMMIILIVLFVVGGPMYSELCRNLIHIETSPALDPMNTILQEILDERTSIDYKVNLASILKQCKDNGPLYQAFSVDQIVNLTKVLDLDKYDVEKELLKIKDIRINIGSIDILDSDAESKLMELANAQLDVIDFNSYYTQLEKNPVESRLSSVANSLETLAIQNTATTEFGNNLRSQATELRNLDTTLVTQLEQTMPKLKASIQTLQSEIEGNHESANFTAGVNALIQSMKQLESQIDNEANSLVSEYLFNLADSLYSNAKKYVNEISYNLQHTIGKCGSLYNSLDVAITAGCESFLNPWNAFWFSMGWCLITLITCLIVALVLVTEYRKTDDYEPADNKSFDDPNFDAYAGSYPGDNIPLEERRKYRPLAHRNHRAC